MAKVRYLHPSEPVPIERHVAVVIHRDHMGTEKGYFYDTAESDHGGSGPFDWRLSEAIQRAEQFATQQQIHAVVVRTKRS